jgi:hypothetical protein
MVAVPRRSVDERGVVMARLVGEVGPCSFDAVLDHVQAGETYTEANDEDYRTGPGHDG